MVWHHIDTCENPADIVSRGSDPLTLKNQSLWWFGPTFLRKEREYWPDSQTVKISIATARKEITDISYF